MSGSGTMNVAIDATSAKPEEQRSPKESQRTEAQKAHLASTFDTLIESNLQLSINITRLIKVSYLILGFATFLLLVQVILLIVVLVKLLGR